ncbi:hypothetical protein BESB_054900 [Besnoitia besnoiti]|uniref:Transmembrane protein n=1 Tax=Besnoitia besnoiti TaxID=94643 RepID=A0A2A9MD79_BESBE|nr:hypothetical protein BESB_054900 [Besnoitia besnoiti]PFH35839.1 hypothetical protein BESB_054900 [Besnoitia besnoiti]
MSFAHLFLSFLLLGRLHAASASNESHQIATDIVVGPGAEGVVDEIAKTTDARDLTELLAHTGDPADGEQDAEQLYLPPAAVEADAASANDEHTRAEDLSSQATALATRKRATHVAVEKRSQAWRRRSKVFARSVLLFVALLGGIYVFRRGARTQMSLSTDVVGVRHDVGAPLDVSVPPDVGVPPEKPPQADPQPPGKDLTPVLPTAAAAEAIDFHHESLPVEQQPDERAARRIPLKKMLLGAAFAATVAVLAYGAAFCISSRVDTTHGPHYSNESEPSSGATHAAEPTPESPLRGGSEGLSMKNVAKFIIERGREPHMIPRAVKDLQPEAPAGAMYGVGTPSPEFWPLTGVPSWLLWGSGFTLLVVTVRCVAAVIAALKTLRSTQGKLRELETRRTAAGQQFRELKEAQRVLEHVRADLIRALVASAVDFGDKLENEIGALTADRKQLESNLMTFQSRLREAEKQRVRERKQGEQTGGGEKGQGVGERAAPTRNGEGRPEQRDRIQALATHLQQLQQESATLAWEEREVRARSVKLDDELAATKQQVSQKNTEREGTPRDQDALRARAESARKRR